MPLRTETIDFEEEIQRLQDEMEDLAEQVSEMEEDTPDDIAKTLLAKGSELNNQINILKALQSGDVEGVETTTEITLAGLTSGEADLADDIADKHDNLRHRNAWVAVGTRDAPYLEHDPEEPLTVAACEETTLRLGDMPRPFVDWAEKKISTLSHIEEERGNGFLNLVQEKHRTGGE